IALTEFIRKKQSKTPILKGKAATPVATNVVNLMDALRRSVQGSSAAEASEPKAKKGKKRPEGQREMLLPIAGKGSKGAKEARTSKSSGTSTTHKRTTRKAG